MALWRFGRGWSDAEMKAYLAALADRTVNFDTPPEQMTLANGWTVDGEAEVPIGTEPPGPPLADGFFARAQAGADQLRLLRPVDRGRPFRPEHARSSGATCSWN